MRKIRKIIKKHLLGLLFVIPFLATAQEFEIPPVDGNEYFNIIEWKGMGAILMGRDPNSNTKQISLTLVDNQMKSVWDEKFNPKTSDKFFYISSDNARYVYFLDNLELDNGKVYFSQLNSAGNIKSTSVAIGTAVKSLGKYDYNKLQLVNVVVTDKALVHHFRYDDKDSKSVVEIATFITHHNFRCYAVELGSIPTKLLKEENYGNWDYIGFTDDNIYFASRTVSNKKIGWDIKQFSSKANPINGFFVEAPDNDLLSVENIGFGSTGKHYLETEKSSDKGLLCQINSTIYLVGGKKQQNAAELTLYKLDGGEWKKVNDMQLNYFIEKKPLKLGIYPMNEGVGYHLDHNGYNKASIITFDKNTPSAHNSFTELTVYNPSSVFFKKEKSEFSVTLPAHILVFDIDQLGGVKPVKFELRSK
jgi:hypothetical protein